MVEMLLAVSLLTMIVAATFSLYKYSTKNFQVGSWRLEEGKRLQHLNSQITRDLSLVPPYLASILETGEINVKKATPVWINSLCYSENDNSPNFLNIGNTANWVCLMSFSIATQHISASTLLGSEEVKGKWCGVALWVKDGKFKYIKDGRHSQYTSVPAQLPPAIDYPGPDIVADGLDIENDNSKNMQLNSDTSAEEISFVGKKSSNNIITSLEITVKSVRREGNRLTDTGLTQKVLVKLASGTSILTF